MADNIEELREELKEAKEEIARLKKDVENNRNAVIHFYRVEAAGKVVLKKDETERKLGKRAHTCRVCGAKGDFESYLSREMMQNKRDEFEYFVCPECGCLQIAEVPDNLGDYYGEGYYSFALPANPDKKYKSPATNHDKILDVGCGSGVWLSRLADEGYDNLFGCDPFLSQEVRHGDRVYIKNCSIHDMEGEGTFNLIHFGDSFEHVTDPLETMQSAARLLKDDGIIEMTIPTFPNVAFELFGPHWYQLDAPRHIFLRSRASMEYLADKCGLKVEKFVYDSNAAQMFRSFFYQHGVPFNDITWELALRFFTQEQLDEFAKNSEECNKNGFGDHMSVYLTKKEQPKINEKPVK